MKNRFLLFALATLLLPSQIIIATDPEKPSSEKSFLKDKWAWVTAGVAGVATAVGAGMGGLVYWASKNKKIADELWLDLTTDKKFKSNLRSHVAGSFNSNGAKVTDQWLARIIDLIYAKQEKELAACILEVKYEKNIVYGNGQTEIEMTNRIAHDLIHSNDNWFNHKTIRDDVDTYVPASRSAAKLSTWRNLMIGSFAVAAAALASFGIYKVAQWYKESKEEKAA